MIDYGNNLNSGRYINSIRLTIQFYFFNSRSLYDVKVLANTTCSLVYGTGWFYENVTKMFESG